MTFKPMAMDLEARTIPNGLAALMAAEALALQQYIETTPGMTPQGPLPYGIDGLPTDPLIIVDVQYWDNN